MENYSIPQSNELGRKTFFWYRIYCAVIAALNLLVAILGIVIVVVRPKVQNQTPEEVLIMGIVYAVVGLIVFLIFAVATFLPPKPFNWIVGIVMIALGFTSCCFVPFCIPLLIFWIKPETKAFFGRSS